MHPVFLCFQGVEKGCIGNEWVKKIYEGFEDLMKCFQMLRIICRGIPFWVEERSVRITPEMYVELSRASTMELFWESSYRLFSINYIRKKSSIVDPRLGSE